MSLAKHLLTCAVVLFLITSCTSTPTSPAISTIKQPPQIKDPQFGQDYIEPFTQTIRTNNCDGANPTTTFSRSLSQGQTTFF